MIPVVVDDGLLLLLLLLLSFHRRLRVRLAAHIRVFITLSLCWGFAKYITLKNVLCITDEVLVRDKNPCDTPP